MKIKQYAANNRENGYELIAETKDEKLILGSLRNGAFFSDGLFKYGGWEQTKEDKQGNFVSKVYLIHNATPQQIEDKWKSKLEKKLK